MNGLGSRIVVIGVTGSGKSTLSKQLSALMDLHYIELDNLFWKPNWEMSNSEEFVKKIEKELSVSDHWVVDGNYLRSGAPIIWEQADTLIWLNYPLRVNLWRLWKRTWGRFLRRERLWDAENMENLWKHFFTKDSLFWYAISSYHDKQRRYTTVFNSPEYASYHRIQLTSPEHTVAWLKQISADVR